MEGMTQVTRWDAEGATGREAEVGLGWTIRSAASRFLRAPKRQRARVLERVVSG